MSDEKIKTIKKHYVKKEFKPNKIVDFELSFFSSFLNDSNGAEYVNKAITSLSMDIYDKFSIPVYIYRSMIDSKCTIPTLTSIIGRVKSFLNTTESAGENDCIKAEVEVFGSMFDRIKNIERYLIVPICKVDRESHKVCIFKLVILTPEYMQKLETMREKRNTKRQYSRTKTSKNVVKLDVVVDDRVDVDDRVEVSHDVEVSDSGNTTPGEGYPESIKNPEMSATPEVTTDK